MKAVMTEGTSLPPHLSLSVSLFLSAFLSVPPSLHLPLCLLLPLCPSLSLSPPQLWSCPTASSFPSLRASGPAHTSWVCTVGSYTDGRDQLAGLNPHSKPLEKGCSAGTQDNTEVLSCGCRTESLASGWLPRLTHLGTRNSQKGRMPRRGRCSKTSDMCWTPEPTFLPRAPSGPSGEWILTAASGVGAEDFRKRMT